MSTTIDERVVEMRFDNKQFESNAKESLSTLDKLKQALDLSASTKGFENLEKAANGVDVSGISNAIENVKLKFSALEIAAIAALANITNKAIDAGVNLAKSLSIDQITAGWSKYGDKTSAVQTIMAATAKDFTDTGEQMEYVSDQLDKLNWFTDETSYSFLDMVNNIGKFTSNNVKLDTAVTAMQGISTWAAISGANVGEAGRAMYNLSQAIAVGAVKLMDWKSIENANMATSEFKQTAIDTAVAMGTLTKSGDGVYKTMKGNEVSVSNFNSALSDAWFSSDVLLKTLDQYGGFTDLLYEATDALGDQYDTVSELLSAVDEYKEGNLDIQEVIENTGLTAKEVTDIFDKLSSSTYDLGRRSFAAAQEAKTFQEAIDATKDAVSTGWMNTFELIFGDYTEAKKLWTTVANEMWEIFASSGEARNDLLKGWKKLGGRDTLWEGVANSWNAIKDVIYTVKDAFRDIFPETTAERLVELTNKFKELTEKLKPADETLDKIKRTFKGVFAVIDILKQAASSVVDLLFPGVSIAGKFADGILGVTANIGDWIVALDDWIKKNEIFKNGVEKVHGVLKFITDSLKKFVDLVKDFVSTHFESPDLGFISDIGDTIKKRLEPAKPVLEYFRDLFKTIGEYFKKLGPVVSNIIKTIGKVLSSLGTAIANAFSGAGFNSFMDLINGGVLAGVGVGLVKFIDKLTKTADSFKGMFEQAGGFVDGIKQIKDAILDTFGAFQSQLKSKILLNIAKAIAILTASVVVLCLLDPEKLNASLGAITVLLVDLFASISIFEKIMGKSGFATLSKVSRSLAIISAAILLLAFSMKVIGSIDSDKLLGALGVVTALVTEMTGVAILLGKFGNKVNVGVLSIMAFAGSIYILSKSVEVLGKLNFKQLLKGLAGVSVLITELAAFMFAAKFGNFKPSQAIGILILSASLLILQKSVEAFGKMDLDAIGKGLLAVGGILAELTLFNFAAGKSKNILSASTSMLVMAGALRIMQKPLESFGNMSIEQIGKALLVMGGALAEIAIAMRFMPKDSLSTSAALLVAASALTIINKVILSMSELVWEEIARGLVTLGVALAEISIAMHLMKGALSGAAAMVVMSTALLLFVPVIKSLGGMEWSEIAKGLITLAGAFTIIGVAGLLLEPLTPAILGLSGAIALLGIGIAAAGVGVLAFSAGLTALSVSGVAAATAIVSMLEILVVGLFNAIRDGATAIGGAVKAIILVICDVVVECVPEVVNTILVVIEEVLSALAEHMPSIVYYLSKFIIGLLNSLGDELPEIVQAAVNLFVKFFAGIIDALRGLDTNVLLDALAGVGLISVLLIACAAFSTIGPAAMTGVLQMGATIAELALVIAAIGALGKIPGLSWLIEQGGDFLEVVGVAIGKFFGGIAGGFAESMASKFPKIGTYLSEFMINARPFFDGASKLNPSMLDGVNSLAKTVLILTAADIINGLTSWFTGESSFAGFGKELAIFAPYFKRYAKEVEGINPDVVSASANAALALAEMASKLPNNGGLSGKIFGENYLSEFGKELETFAPHLAKYAEDVKDLDPLVVEASARAAQVLADMAAKLPNSGGLSAKILGDNTLSQFGEELEKFAPHLAQYSKDVKDVKPEVVEGSAAAAQVLADMASTLPNSGGMVTWFVGDNTLSRFGKELAKFGPYIFEYAKSVSDLDPAVVEASANAALALAELANMLPNTGGIKSWFSGDNDMSDFGKELVKFGKSMTKYYKSVSTIQTDKLSSVVTQVERLVKVATDVSKIDASTMSTFGNNLKKMGNTGVSEFVKAFDNSDSTVKAAIAKMVTYTNNALNDGSNKISKSAEIAGNKIPESLAYGVEKEQPTIKSTIQKLAKVIIETLNSNLQTSTFKSIGQGIVTSLDSGINSASPSAIASANAMSRGVRTAIRDNLRSEDFKSIGENVAKGLSNGIISKTKDISNAAGQAAQAAIYSARATLQVRSPSRIFEAIGEFVDEGFAKGILGKISLIKKATDNMTENAVNPVRLALSTISKRIREGFNDGLNPVISPVMDLSGVKQGVGQISSMLEGLDVSASYNKALAASSGFNNSTVRNNAAGESESMIEKLKGKIDKLSETPAKVFNNTFNIKGDNPKEIAEEVSRIIQRDIERKEKVWE